LLNGVAQLGHEAWPAIRALKLSWSEDSIAEGVQSVSDTLRRLYGAGAGLPDVSTGRQELPGGNIVAIRHHDKSRPGVGYRCRRRVSNCDWDSLAHGSKMDLGNFEEVEKCCQAIAIRRVWSDKLASPV
jgi:hypothetical protein